MPGDRAGRTGGPRTLLWSVDSVGPGLGQPSDLDTRRTRLDVDVTFQRLLRLEELGRCACLEGVALAAARCTTCSPLTETEL